MKVDALKLELIQWLASLEDKEILQSIFFYKNIQQSTDWWDQLTEEQLRQVNAGIEDVKKGRTFTSAEVWEKYGRKARH